MILPFVPQIFLMLSSKAISDIGCSRKSLRTKMREVSDDLQEFTFCSMEHLVHSAISGPSSIVFTLPLHLRHFFEISHTHYYNIFQTLSGEVFKFIIFSSDTWKIRYFINWSKDTIGKESTKF